MVRIFGPRFFGPVRGPDFGPDFWHGFWSGFLVRILIRIFSGPVRGTDFGPSFVTLVLITSPKIRLSRRNDRRLTIIING